MYTSVAQVSTSSYPVDRRGTHGIIGSVLRLVAGILMVPWTTRPPHLKLALWIIAGGDGPDGPDPECAVDKVGWEH